MRKILLSLFLILMLLPISSGFSQEKSDTPSTLSVALTNDSPFVYKDYEGYTVVIGDVVNNNEITSVTNVQISVNFYDVFGNELIEVVGNGTTVLEVIPELGTSPYLIKSTTPNTDIGLVSVKLVNFETSISKSELLSIESTDVYLDENLKLSGVLTNGGSPITDTFVHVAIYDNFIPPRLVGLSSIPIGDVEANEQVDFYLDEEIYQRAASLKIFAQSNVFYSNIIDEKIPQQITKLVTISDVSLNDSQGNKLSEITVGSTVNIKSNVWVQFSADQKSNETPYTYYTQVKNSDFPTVEFLGKSDGRFIGTGSQSISIDWIPENSGIFFVETFVWDRNNVPIADKGPIVVLVVN